jgi:hypothetical protein
MSCNRCCGFVVSDVYLGAEGEIDFLRCINCGAVQEQTINGRGPGAAFRQPQRRWRRIIPEALPLDQGKPPIMVGSRER